MCLVKGPHSFSAYMIDDGYCYQTRQVLNFHNNNTIFT